MRPSTKIAASAVTRIFLETLVLCSAGRATASHRSPLIIANVIMEKMMQR